jgi:hypothetical protein
MICRIFIPALGLHKQTKPSTVNAALLTHYFRNKTDNPFLYIGISKLSCHACCIYFEAFNCINASVSGPFHTRGSHNKLYLCWHYPLLVLQAGHRLSDPDVQVLNIMFIEFLGNEFAKYVKEVYHKLENPNESEGGRVYSDSTDESGGHAGTDTNSRVDHANFNNITSTLLLHFSSIGSSHNTRHQTTKQAGS